MALTEFARGKLKIIAHVREELDLAGITFDSIHSESGGTNTPPGVLRVIVTAQTVAHSLDLSVADVEDCEAIVAGDVWYKIAALIERCKRPRPP